MVISLKDGRENSCKYGVFNLSPYAPLSNIHLPYFKRRYSSSSGIFPLEFAEALYI